MVAGHVGLAVAARLGVRNAPMWTFVLASFWLDVLFAPLFLLGIERLEPVTAGAHGYGQYVIRAEYTHALLDVVVIAAIFGAVAARWWGRRAGIVLGAVVASHWLLDLVVHRADLPLLPGNAGNLPLLGFGLWDSIPGSVAAELAIILGAALLYWRVARPTVRTGATVLLSSVAVLALDVLAS